MTPDRWREIRRIFDAALEIEGEGRAAFVVRACEGDPSLRKEVGRLLRDHDQAGDFIERPFFRLSPASATEAEDGTGEGLSEIGPYAVERVLGRGGMGTVYLAARADAEYQQRVAVKVLRRELDTEDLVRRFRGERQILARLEHPSIARLLDGGTTRDGRPYLVMEHVEGEPLDRYCDARRLSISRRLELFRQVCSAVHFAHQSLIVHRDLKPGNILVTADGHVRLLDFGIAKLLEPESFPETVVVTEPGAAPMTPGYASPEQIRGAAVTTASDVYSLGVVLYELLCGRRPFVSQRRDELVRTVCEESPPRPSAAASRTQPTVAALRDTDPRRFRRRLRGDLDNIALMALGKEPRRRYASAEELSRDVERHLSHRPIRARPDRWAYRTAKFVRRHRWSVTAATTALVALVGFLVALVVQRGQILSQYRRAEEVTRVLIDLFEVSDPDLAHGAQVTAREVMDRGAREIPQRLAGQPRLQADLLETIGGVYRKLGLYDDARALYEEALALRAGNKGDDARRVASNLLVQGELLDTAGRFTAAESRYREALEILERIGEQHGPEAERGLVGLALAFQRQGRFDESERRHREALAVARGLFGARHPRTADNLQNLGTLLRERGELSAAEDSLRQALDVYQELYGEEHTEVAGLYNDLGLVAQAAGQYKSAEEWFRRALRAQAKLYSDDHPTLAVTRFNMASSLHDRGLYEEAEALCQKALENHRQGLGDRHPTLAAMLNLLGLIRWETGDLDAAERLFREALDIWTAVYGEAHPEVAVGLMNVAGILKEQDELDEAEALLRDALRVRRQAFGDEHAKTAEGLNSLAQILRRRGDLEGADALYREVLAIRRRVLGKEHPDVGQTLHNLAVVLRHAEDYAAAEEAQREALEIYRRKLGERHPHVGILRRSLANILVSRGRAVEAEAEALSALSILAETLSEDHSWVVAANCVLAESLTTQRRFGEAERILLRSYDHLKAVQGASTVETEESLIALYKAWGQPEKAARYGE